MTEKEWLRIYRETVHPLFGYVAKRTGGNRELAEDIVQESYLRALADWMYKAVPDSGLAWLKRVARNLLVDWLRQRKRADRADPDAAQDIAHPASSNQVDSLELFLAISSLGEKKAEIIESFYFDGKSLKEIAAKLDITERAVEGKLRRARQSLRPLLPEKEPHGGNDE